MALPTNSRSLLGLEDALKVRVFFALPNLWSAIALRMTCHKLNDIYRHHETSIRNGCRDKLVAAVDDCYKFLTTLYVNEPTVHHPPTGGWPDIPLEKSNRRDKDFVVDVARRLPYITGDCGLGDGICALHSYKIEHNCVPLDYSSGFHRCDNTGRLQSTLTDSAKHSAEHCIELARACRREGHYLYLDTMTGVIIDDVVGMAQQQQHDQGTTYYKQIVAYFEERKENFRALTYVVAGDDNIYEAEEGEADDFKFMDPDSVRTNLSDWEKLDYEPYARLLGQKERFPGKLDLAWVCRLYRKFGWPGPDYQKQEALKAVRDYYEHRLGSSAPMCFELHYP